VDKFAVNSVGFEVLNGDDYEECYLLGCSQIEIYLLILKMVVLHGATSQKVVYSLLCALWLECVNLS
jgi:hypothetical protein